MKNEKKYFTGYRHEMGWIEIGIDGTDHITFFCSKCDSVLEIADVETRLTSVKTDGSKKDNCTDIYLACNNCKLFGKRKFYWITEKGNVKEKKNIKKHKNKQNSNVPASHMDNKGKYLQYFPYAKLSIFDHFLPTQTRHFFTLGFSNQNTNFSKKVTERFLYFNFLTGIDKQNFVY